MKLYMGILTLVFFVSTCQGDDTMKCYDCVSGKFTIGAPYQNHTTTNQEKLDCLDIDALTEAELKAFQKSAVNDGDNDYCFALKFLDKDDDCVYAIRGAVPSGEKLPFEKLDGEIIEDGLRVFNSYCSKEFCNSATSLPKFGFLVTFTIAFLFSR